VIIPPVCAFALASCLILGNNFVGEMIAEIFSWGFVKMPGVIFELDLDGIADGGLPASEQVGEEDFDERE
jgi:hypothetical protein